MDRRKAVRETESAVRQATEATKAWEEVSNDAFPPGVVSLDPSGIGVHVRFRDYCPDVANVLMKEGWVLSDPQPSDGGVELFKYR